MATPESLPESRVLQQACGWGRRQADAYLESLVDSEREALGTIDRDTPFGAELRRIMDAVADRKALVEPTVATPPPPKEKRIAKKQPATPNF